MDGRILLQQLVVVESLVTSFAPVLVVKVEAEIASDTGKGKLTYIELHVFLGVC